MPIGVRGQPFCPCWSTASPLRLKNHRDGDDRRDLPGVSRDCHQRRLRHAEEIDPSQEALDRCVDARVRPPDQREKPQGPDDGEREEGRAGESCRSGGERAPQPPSEAEEDQYEKDRREGVARLLEPRERGVHRENRPADAGGGECDGCADHRQGGKQEEEGKRRTGHRSSAHDEDRRCEERTIDRQAEDRTRRPERWATECTGASLELLGEGETDGRREGGDGNPKGSTHSPMPRLPSERLRGDRGDGSTHAHRQPAFWTGTDGMDGITGITGITGSGNAGTGMSGVAE